MESTGYSVKDMRPPNDDDDDDDDDDGDNL